MFARSAYVALALGLWLAFPAAQAQENQRIAYSSRLGLEILAQKTGTSWCREELDLTIQARDTAFFTSPDLSAVFNQVGTILTKECPAAQRARLSGKTQTSGDTVVWQGTAQAGANWKPQSSNLAAAPPDTTAPPQKPTLQSLITGQDQPQPAAPATPARQAAAPQPATVPQPPPPAAPPALPRDINYAGLLVLMLKDNPTLATSASASHCWAAYRYQRDYHQSVHQEFKLQPILLRAQDDLAEAIRQQTSRRVVVSLRTSFGAYDFKAQRFPIRMNFDQVNVGMQWSCQQTQPQLPNNFTLKISDLEAINGLPMDSDAAQAFATKRTRYGSIDRDIVVALTLKVQAGLTMTNWNNVSANTILESATIYADSELRQPLHRFDEASLEKLRADRQAEKIALAKAEEERRVEQRRRQLEMQRQSTIQALSRASDSTKLANWINPGEINIYTRLNNLRDARMQALLQGKPVQVSMLVQADGNGRGKVGTKWPGQLDLNLSDGLPALKSQGWYLVLGLLSVSEQDALRPAQLTVSTLHACTAAKCSDAADAAAIVDRKIGNAAPSR